MLLLYRRYVLKHPLLLLLPRRIRKNAFLLRALVGRCYRLLCRPSRIGPMLHDRAQAVRRWIRPPFSAKAMTLAEARAVGGAIPLQELERVWEASDRCRRAVCVATGLELRQLEIVLGARRVAVMPQEEADGDHRILPPVDLVIVVGTDATSGPTDRLLHRYGADAKKLLVSAAGEAQRFSIGSADPPEVQRSPGRGSTASGGDRRKVLLLNDSGFQYGAGTALKRQAASFLLNGWDVAVIAWRAGHDRRRPVSMGSECSGSWYGVRTLGDPDRSKTYSSERLVAEVKARLQFKPDLIVLGNTHAAGWPIDLPARLGELGAPVLAYMHDCYWVTGRCAHPASCTLFRTGCDERCPTAGEYPSLAPEKIAPAWRERSAVFEGHGKIPLVANSRWTLDVALQRYGSTARSDMVHLGLDARLFAPMPKSVVRRVLGLPADKVLIAMGAVDIDNQWKGGAMFESVYRALRSRDDVGLLLFGRASERLPSTRSFGLIEDERLMPFLFNAADIYVTTATAESFGQTLLEASACALPVVAFKVGGITDIVVHEESGLLVEPASVPDLLAAIERLVASQPLMEKMGRNGRARVEDNFTLAHQGELWNDCLTRLRKGAASDCSSLSAMSGPVR
jgi:glycosyltransferase involved in cell wall biosynthesis